MSLLQNSNAIESGGYLIERSLRFQSASSQYLSRTPASAGNTLTWTFSAWVKRGSLSTGAPITIFAARSGGNSTYIAISEKLTITYNVGGTTTYDLASAAVFRDPAAWYHVVIVSDLTQATSTDRIKMYVNGVLQTYTGTPPTQNYANSYINTTYTHAIGALDASNWYFDGYMTEINFVNAQALTPSSFGETDALTGVWVAKRYTGTYGTNGFYLKFNDGTSTTTLGQDRSGNANNWTLTNFTRSAGVSDCWMYDVPSGNGSPSATQPSSNYCVLNPLIKNPYASPTNANLKIALGTTGANGTELGSLTMTSGKWYFEIHPTTANAMIGILRNTQSALYSVISGALYVGQIADGYAYYGSGQKYNSNTATSYGASFTNGDIIGCYFDASTGTLGFTKNGVDQGTAYSGLTGEFYPAISDGSANIANANFGQRSFAYTPPSGFKALCTANLPAPTIAKGNQYMDATLYTGNGGSQTITNAGSMSPDLVWCKSRSQADQNVLMDTVRGVEKRLYSNLTNAEDATGGLASVNSNGFSLNSSSSSINNNTVTYVAWQWDAGSSTVTNTSGSISSQVRASTTSGVSIVTYTGTGANATVGHGLGVAPSMIIVKKRSSATSSGWAVYHASLGATRYIALQDTGGASTVSTLWNNTAPTSNVFTIGTDGWVNASAQTNVAYCFAEIAGFSKFGSYTGNGSADGPFIFTGFTPKFVMVKRTDTTGGWSILDTARNPFNVSTTTLRANVSDAEVTGLGGANTMALDFTSNGFKFRDLGAGYNASGGSYIYACFAENPFSVSNAR